MTAGAEEFVVEINGVLAPKMKGGTSSADHYENYLLMAPPGHHCSCGQPWIEVHRLWSARPW